jgi:probable rRNA maturation factor
MYDIAIANEQTLLDVDEEHLRAAASRVLAAEEIRGATVSIAIVDDASLRELNRRHLNHDYETDVLSFLLECELEGDVLESDTSPPRGRGKRIEGEVIASAEMAIKRAAEFHWRPIDELTYYVVHGLLHLAGYDDLTDDERTLMRARERAILESLNLSPRGSSE